MLDRTAGLSQAAGMVSEHRPDLASLVSHWQAPGRGQRRLLSLLRGHRMKRLLRRMLDESEFLSDYGVRALSRAHLEHPYVLQGRRQSISVGALHAGRIGIAAVRRQLQLARPHLVSR